MEQPREPVLTVVATIERNNEEIGGYEAYSKQLVLSPTLEEVALAQLRDEARGKQIAEAEESSNSELLNLIRNMKDEMRGKDEQIME